MTIQATNAALATAYGWTTMQNGRWLNPAKNSSSVSPPDYCRNIVVLSNVVRFQLTPAERVKVAEFILQMRGG